MLIADAHVHFHSCFRRDVFLDAAWRNLSDAARHPPPGDAFLAYLLLTEPPGVNYYRRWHEEAGTTSGRWRVERTEESCSIAFLRDDGATLIVVGGKQIPTTERLEVLALGTAEEILPGLPLGECLRRARESAQIVCIPWGFGKWTFGRGAMVLKAIETIGERELALGDNAGRPARAPNPRLFGLAQRVGVPVLPGSDPLPFKRHEDRAGSFSFSVPGVADRSRPMEQLRTAVFGEGAVMTRGTRIGALAFLRDQVELRLTRGAPRLATQA
jgi:hypothetical protein